MNEIAAIAFAVSGVLNGLDVSLEAATHTSGYSYPDPLGVLEISTSPMKDVVIYARHISSIPDSRDNEFGGINMVGVRFTFHIKGVR